MKRRTVLTLTAATSLAIAGLAVPQAADADAATKAHCSASASPKHPQDYSNVHIAVNSIVNGGHVHTVAHYATTNTPKNATANKHGNATVTYDISGATKGRKVSVSVTVYKGKKTANCSTSFTPR